MKRFTNILFVTGPNSDDSAALDQAVALAQNNQARLTIVGLIDASQKHSSDAKDKRLLDAMVEHRLDELNALLSEVSGNSKWTEVKVLVGRDFLEIIREVIRNQRDLVVKSTELGGGIARMFSSTDMKLLRKCPCAVWLINSTQQRGYKEILAAVDFDPEDPQVDVLNGQILEMAASLALSEFADLHVIHAWRLPQEGFFRSPRSGFTDDQVDKMAHAEEAKRREWLELLVRKHCSAQDPEALEYLDPQIHLIKGSAGQLVPDLGEKLGVELVVMGTVGRTGIPGFLIGNTAENILHRIQCSVLTAKPAGFVSPVTLDE